MKRKGKQMNKKERKKGIEKARRQIQEYMEKNPDAQDLISQAFTLKNNERNENVQPSNI